MHPKSRLDNLRTHRVKPEFDRAIGGEVAKIRAKYERIVRDGGSVSAAWDRAVPERFRGSAAVVGCKGGVLTIRCRSASDKYALDRWLRGGGETQVREAANAAFSTVRLVLR